MKLMAGKTKCMKPMVGLIATLGLLGLLGLAALVVGTIGMMSMVGLASPRTIRFSGYDWVVKSSETPVGPGPNYFSDSKRNVWVDKKGLHLKVVQRNGKWYCSEVWTAKSFGYGTYSFYVASRVDLVDRNVVVGLFTWDDAPDFNHREIDIEFSRWGQEINKNAQYVVQPWDKPGNIKRFDINLKSHYSTHRFSWGRKRIAFKSLHGHHRTPPDPSFIIASWIYKGSDNPPPGNEKVHVNLWLFDADGDGIGDPPSNGKEVELIIKKFVFKKEKELSPH